MLIPKKTPKKPNQMPPRMAKALSSANLKTQKS